MKKNPIHPSPRLERPLAASLAAAFLTVACGSGNSSSSAQPGTDPGSTQSVTVQATTGQQVTLSTNVGALDNVQAVAAPAAASATVAYPVGWFSYNVTDIIPGTTATISFTLPAGTAVSGYAKCIGTACGALPAGQVSVSGNTLTLTITDGGPGDADGIANGIIVDPGAPTAVIGGSSTGGTTGTSTTGGGTGGSTSGSTTGDSTNGGTTGGTTGGGTTGGSTGSATTGGSTTGGSTTGGSTTGGSTTGGSTTGGTTTGGGTTGSTTGGTATCPETGAYACKTGSSEPLYPYQWALNYASSFFASYPAVFGGGSDLDVEPVHSAGNKGQGVTVIVLDDGIDIRNADLSPNVNATMTRNFDYAASDTTASPFGDFGGAALLAAIDPTPGTPTDNGNKAHGTNAAGIIAAAQNGVGVMGISPRVTLGGARFIGASNASTTEAYGGGAWSKNAWVFNASFGSNPAAPPSYDVDGSPSNPELRAMPNLRSSKGALFVKAAGNEFQSIGSGDDARTCPSVVQDVLSCETPANDPESLEQTVILVGAGNAKGVRASYSSASALNWITGLGGEYGDGGLFGEQGSGPVMFSTDLRTCTRGYAITGATGTSDFNIPGTATNTNFNPNCDFSTMNGTSAATPTVSGVISLILAANPNLTWRDVRDILRATAKKIDTGYGTDASRQSGNRGNLFDLVGNTFTATAANASNGLVAGAKSARVDYGWQTNAAGYAYSNWYGFGLADAAAAVTMAKSYTSYQTAALSVPSFTALPVINSFSYGQVSLLGTFTTGTAATQVDELQIRVSGSICVGSVGFYVQSPSGAVSALSAPLNSYYNNGVATVSSYALGSYAFYGEPAAVAGKTWSVYAVAATPGTGSASCASYSGSNPVTLATPLTVEYRVLARP